MVDADDRQALGTRVTLLAIAAMTAAGGVASAAPEPEPLEVLAVDTTAFPHVVVDVAVPERERASEMPSEAFSLPGLTDVTVERLDPADLTLAIVLDDGPEVRTPGLAFQQGAAAELVRILPADVEVMIRTSSGVEIEPTVDRAAAMDAIASSRPSSTFGTLAAAAGDAVQRLETVPDGRRQLVVMTGEASDIQEEEATSLLASLDRAGAGMRVVSMGDTVGPRLAQAAHESGGAAAPVGWGADAALRAVDVLSTTFAEQYRLRATMPAPGPLTVRLTANGRSYETTIPDVGVTPTTTSTPSTTSTTSAAVAVATIPATAAARPTMGPGVPASSGEGSSTPVVEAGLAIAAIVLIVAVVVAQRRRSRRRVATRTAATRRSAASRRPATSRRR